MVYEPFNAAKQAATAASGMIVDPNTFNLHSGWRKLLERGARTIYPAHGKPFAAEVFRRAR